MQNSAITQLDNFISRLLFVTPQPKAAEPTEEAPQAERAFSLSLLFSGIRCILQYAIFPFLLPIIGVAGAFSVWISMVINVVAIAANIYSLRRFWQLDYKRKWQFLPVSLTALVILSAFIVLDLQVILAS